MSNQNDWQLPRGLQILQIFGVILFGLGIAKHFGGTDVIPPELIPSLPLLQDPALVLIAVGLGLQAPAVIYQTRKAIKRLRTRRTANSDQTR